MIEAQVINNANTLIERLQQIPDRRDNRGKRHKLPFVLACVLMAILSNRSYMSSIQRYIHHKIEWLKDVFDSPEATAVSRAQLPNILARVDWEALNAVFKALFGLCIIEQHPGEWKAVDGKSLKGTIVDPTQAHDHERLVLIVGHTSHDILEQQRFSGAKESEVTVVRDLLEQTGLVGDKISLDAGHAYPETLEPIHAADGMYVVQIKQNQPHLFTTLAQLAEQVEQEEMESEQVEQEEMESEQAEQEEMESEQAEQEEMESEQVEFPAAGVVISTVEKGHGRLEERTGRVLSLEPDLLAQRWEPTGMKTVIVMDRRTEDLNTGKTSDERSYYVSNQSAPTHEQELFDAVRGHWRVESMNWIRDVTFNEDQVRTTDPNTGQILSSLRTMALTLLQSLHPKNMKAKLEELADKPDALHDLLVRFNLVSATSAS